MSDTKADALHLRREIVFQALEEACDKIEESARKEIARQELSFKKRLDESQSKAIEKQQSLETEICSLKQHVASLAAELEQTRAIREIESVTGTDNDVANVGVGSGIPTAADTGLQQPNKEKDSPESIEGLLHSLAKSRSRYESIKEQLDLAVAVARKRKTETLNWVKYADSLELKIKRLEKKIAAGTVPLNSPKAPTTSVATPHIPPTPVTVEKCLPSKNLIVEGPADKSNEIGDDPSRPSLSASFSSTASSFCGFAGGDEDNEKQEDDNVGLPQRDGPSLSAARHDDTEPDNEATIESTQGEPYSDEPQLQVPTLSASSKDRSSPVVIKNEPSSDGPEVVWERPVKKQRRESPDDHRPQTPPAKAVVKQERTESISRSVSGFMASQDSLDLDEGQLAMPTPRKRHLVYQQQGSSQSNDSETPNEDVPQQRTKERHPDQTPLAALTPLSVNVRREVRSGAGGKKDPVKYMRQLKRGVESLAEDNEGHTPAAGSKQQLPGSTRSTRLQSLLNSRPPEPSPIGSALRTAAVQRFNVSSPISGAFGQPPPKRTLPQRRNGSKTTNGTANASLSTPRARLLNRATEKTTAPLTEVRQTAAAKSASKKGTPQAHPADRLRLDDFKINPAFNNGETFAFNEVVRSRTDRGNLAGCTDSQCCGKTFRSMAESELNAAGSGHVSRSDSVAMMERYLGDEAFVLARMSPEDTKALWLEAKTKELADKYGKHRHRYHRRASPPGFWDADFPTTQEEERHRAEAEQIEKTAIRERYREAMRPGGRWLFRDE